MQLVIKNGMIIASHENEQNISISQHYPTADEIIIVPNDMVVTDRNGYFLADPRPGMELEVLRTSRLLEVNRSVNSYIFLIYDAGTQSSFNMYRQIAKDANNTAALTLIDQIPVFVAQVLSVYYDAKTKIQQAPDNVSILAVTWSWPVEAQPVQLADVLRLLYPQGDPNGT